MSQRAIQILVPEQFDRWVNGFAALPSDVMRQAQPSWRMATEIFYSRTQSAVHIISGDLKSSGGYEVEVRGDEIVGVLKYDSDHAIYEEARGGSHAFIAIGWEQSQFEFIAAMSRTWDTIIRSWRA